MTHFPEHELALYVSGDATEERAMTAHLANCAECRSSLDSFLATSAWLSEMAPEPGERQTEELKRGVLRVVSGGRSRARWIWAASAAAIFIACCTALIHMPNVKKTAAPSRASIQVQRPAEPSHAAPSSWRLASIAPRRKRPLKRGIASVTLVAQEAGMDPVLKMNTSDPNVVILWTVSGGEKNK